MGDATPAANGKTDADGESAPAVTDVEEARTAEEAEGEAAAERQAHEDGEPKSPVPQVRQSLMLIHSF